MSTLNVRIKENKAALQFLQKSLEVGDHGPGCNTGENKANTFINIASVYSSAGKHEVALTFCQRAERLLAEMLWDHIQAPPEDILVAKTVKDNILTALIIAHQNQGVEYEFLG